MNASMSKRNVPASKPKMNPSPDVGEGLCFFGLVFPFYLRAKGLRQRVTVLFCNLRGSLFTAIRGVGTELCMSLYQNETCYNWKLKWTRLSMWEKGCAHLVWCFILIFELKVCDNAWLSNFTSNKNAKYRIKGVLVPNYWYLSIKTTSACLETKNEPVSRCGKKSLAILV